MNRSKSNTKKSKNPEPEKSTARVVVTIVILIALILSAYFFIFNKEVKDETSKTESTVSEQTTSEKKAIDIAKKNDSIKIAKKEYVGKYVSERYPDSFRDLHSDGTLDYKDGIAKGTGTFKIDTTTIAFKYDVGMEASSTIVDNVILDSDGELWKRDKGK